MVCLKTKEVIKDIPEVGGPIEDEANAIAWETN